MACQDRKENQVCLVAEETLDPKVILDEQALMAARDYLVQRVNQVGTNVSEQSISRRSYCVSCSLEFNSVV